MTDLYSRDTHYPNYVRKSKYRAQECLKRGSI